MVKQVSVGRSNDNITKRIWNLIISRKVIYTAFQQAAESAHRTKR